MKKSEKTKLKILEQGLNFASLQGLVDLSIGSLAKAANMSRSGLFAHFKSKENMHKEILLFAEESFKQTVLKPSRREDPKENLEILAKNWLNWTKKSAIKMEGGCPFIRVALAFENRPGEVQSFMEEQQSRLLGFIEYLADSCKEQGLFKKECDSKEFAYQYYSIYLGHNMYSHLIKDYSADNLYFKNIQELIDRNSSPNTSKKR